MEFSRAREILSEIEGNVVVGVSGGVDSMCLLDLVASQIAHDRIFVVHIDHNLRQTSKRDRAFVEDYCQKNGLNIEVFSADILSMRQKSKLSVETQARLFRHEVFAKVCSQKNAVLLLAHNASDQAETVLMHIFRGCGIDGLVGMGEYDGNIIRPLIGVNRSQIEAYMTQNELEFMVDETNLDTKYARNFVRNLLGQVEGRFGGASANINRLSSYAKQVQNAMDCAKTDLIYTKNGVVHLDKSALNSPLKNNFIIESLKRAGLKTDFESKHILAILKLADSENGSKIDLPKGLVCQNLRGSLAFFFADGLNGDNRGGKIGLNGDNRGGEIGLNGGCNRGGEIGLKLGENVFFNHKITLTECEIKPNLGEIIVDFDCIKGAIIRFRKNGDLFRPCNGHKKRLSDWLIDKKVENLQKDDIPLICVDKNVLVVCGMELSDSVKITENTQRAVKITLSADYPNTSNDQNDVQNSQNYSQNSQDYSQNSQNCDQNSQNGGQNGGQNGTD